MLGSQGGFGLTFGWDGAGSFTGRRLKQEGCHQRPEVSFTLLTAFRAAQIFPEHHLSPCGSCSAVGEQLSSHPVIPGASPFPGCPRGSAPGAASRATPSTSSSHSRPYTGAGSCFFFKPTTLVLKIWGNRGTKGSLRTLLSRAFPGIQQPKTEKIPVW